MSSDDGNGRTVARKPQRLELAQLRAVAGVLARRSARPAAAFMAVVAAMCIAARWPGALVAIVPAAVMWRRLRR